MPMARFSYVLASKITDMKTTSVALGCIFREFHSVLGVAPWHIICSYVMRESGNGLSDIMSIFALYHFIVI